MSQEGYEHTSAELAAKCNVKFRYSLFAGPAPFEWIARKDLTITSEKLTTWFATQLANAIDDIKNARVRPQFAEVLPFAKNTLACLSHMLSSQVRDATQRIASAGALTDSSVSLLVRALEYRDARPQRVLQGRGRCARVWREREPLDVGVCPSLRQRSSTKW